MLAVEAGCQNMMAAVMPEVRNMATRRMILEARMNILGESSDLADTVFADTVLKGAY